MTGTEKAIMIILFTFVYLCMGFILLWVLSYQEDKKKDREKIDNFVFIMKNHLAMLIKHKEEINGTLCEVYKIRDEIKDLESKKSKKKVSSKEIQE